MRKSIVVVILLSLVVLVGCARTDYGITWRGLELSPENPVIYEPVTIVAQANEAISDEMMRIFHWVITEDGTQREFKTSTNRLPLITFTTPGTKGVLVWVEVYNDNRYKGHEFYGEFEVSTVE